MNEKTIVLKLSEEMAIKSVVMIHLQDWSEEHKQWMGASLNSNLKADPEFDPDNANFNACVDGLEALILQMAVNGIDIDIPVMIKSINDALEGIGNNT